MGKAKRIRAARVPAAPRAKQQPSLLTRNRVLAAVGIAAVVAAVLIGASLLGARDDGGGGDPTAVTGGADVEALLRGIPQAGTALGEDDAPATLVEYADLQCPFCAEWSLRAFPELVADYVRAGRLRIEFRGLTFIGEESEQALRAALGAGEQGRLWNVVDPSRVCACVSRQFDALDTLRHTRERQNSLRRQRVVARGGPSGDEPDGSTDRCLRRLTQKAIVALGEPLAVGPERCPTRDV